MKLYKTVFVLLLLFSFFIRFYRLSSIPEGFHADETDYGYNAYSLLRTGKDEYGKPFPLIYRSFGDYKGAIYAYLTIPFIATAGLNEWSVRAPSAVFGVLFTVLTFAIVYQISKNYRLAILSMALAVISPLGLLLSRVQSDPLVGVFFFYLGFYLFLLWTEHKRIWHLLAAVGSLYIGFFTYSNDQLFVMPFLVLLGVRYWNSWNISVRATTIILFCIFSLTVAGIVVTSAGTRLGQVSIFSTRDVQLPLEEKIREDGAMKEPLLITRAFHNKVTAYGQYLIDNFASYLSYNFLFRQATEPQREQVPDSGVLLLIDLPFLLIGIYTVFRKKYSYGIMAILWVLMVPFALSFTSGETPNIHRFIWAVIPIYLLTATGILAAYDATSRRYRMFLIVCITALFLLNESIYLERLFVHQPIHNPIYRNGPDKELAIALKGYSSSYDIIVSQKILEDMLFFWPIDPATYQKEGSPRDTDNAWYRNFLFVTDACPSKILNPNIQALKEARILYVDKAECSLEKNDVIIKTIKYKNTLNAYYLIEKSTL
ncbi:MAG: phospholipid carrier-dependent glycosyltransferase [Candidatus Gottesmanbacteria bacterium]|nr:phospholipid carrier-dependent glycosyltransferase [Candidatus Gottesmanbacteria bacterium]